MEETHDGEKDKLRPCAAGDPDVALEGYIVAENWECIFGNATAC